MLSIEITCHDNGKKTSFFIELIQRVAKTGKERVEKGPKNPTPRDPVRKVKTIIIIMNIRENERGLPEAVAANEV